MPHTDTNLLQTTDASSWRTSRDALLKEEKAITHQLDALAAKRRALPAVEITDPTRFVFHDPENGSPITLLDAFKGRKQLVMYEMMPVTVDEESGKVDPCSGCAFFLDQISEFAQPHLAARDTVFVAAGPAPVEQILKVKERMGWKDLPLLSSEHLYDSVGKEEDLTWRVKKGSYLFSTFLREREKVYHTYSTWDRGTDGLLNTYKMLDMTKLGRMDGGERGFKLRDEYPENCFD